MKAKQIQVGDCYRAKVSGNLVIVRVDAIREVAQFVRGGLQTVYDVTNLATGRKTTFGSAAKFRCEVGQPPTPEVRDASSHLQ